jgi:glutamate N-acetyltransferase/amino-acid N-acetyltransferase
VKTAIAGEDANWGRVVMAIGRAREPVMVERIGIAFGGHWVARDGAAVADLDEAPVAAHLAGREVDLGLVVGDGPGRAVVWTCDLTHGYIDINADYRS